MRYLVAILLLFCCATVRAEPPKIVKRHHLLPIPENKNMRLFFLDELRAMDLRGGLPEVDVERIVEGRFDGTRWTFKLFDEIGSLADVVRVVLPNEYAESYTIAGTHVDLAWEFESMAEFESDGRIMPVQLRFSGCGRCVSPEEFGRWRLAIDGSAIPEAKGEVRRPERSSN